MQKVNKGALGWYWWEGAWAKKRWDVRKWWRRESLQQYWWISTIYTTISKKRCSEMVKGEILCNNIGGFPPSTPPSTPPSPPPSPPPPPWWYHHLQEEMFGNGGGRETLQQYWWISFPWFLRSKRDISIGHVGNDCCWLECLGMETIYCWINIFSSSCCHKNFMMKKRAQNQCLLSQYPIPFSFVGNGKQYCCISLL